VLDILVSVFADWRLVCMADLTVQNLNFRQKQV